MPRHDKVKIWMGQVGRLEEKIVLTAFISFGLFNIFQIIQTANF
jgi:hypothetical protein